MAKSMVAQIAELEHLPMNELRAKWEMLFNAPPPFCNSRPQMVARLAYRLQELTFGGLSAEAREKLSQIAGVQVPEEAVKTVVWNPGQPIPGTRLIREWKGVLHEVTVQESYFEYAGRRYRSLTAIATFITGTKWNGHEFFGLRRRGAADNSASPQPSGRKGKS